MIETRPVHAQLIALCQQALAEEAWLPGDRFPSERELAQRYSVSRTTANKVIASLVSEGWLEIRKGIGTFVAERPTLFRSLRQIESFTTFAEEQGFRPSTAVTSFEHHREAPADLAGLFGTVSGGVISVRRIRRLDGDPVILEARWLPARRYPGLRQEDLEGSFYRLCGERYGLRLERQEVAIRAVAAPRVDGIEWPVPALCFEGAGLDPEGALLWYQQLHYRGDRFTLLNAAASPVSLPEISLRLNQPSNP